MCVFRNTALNRSHPLRMMEAWLYPPVRQNIKRGIQYDKRWREERKMKERENKSYPADRDPHIMTVEAKAEERLGYCV